MSESSASDRPTSVDKHSSIIPAIAGVVVGSLLTIAAQYYITYQRIELPKIELEAKKAAIEAHKQALALTPSVSTSCNAKLLDGWTWKVMCTTKNSGSYHADVQVNDVRLTLDTDTKEELYESGRGFSVEYPNNKKSFRSAPGTEGNLWFYINFDKNIYKSPVQRNDIVAKVSFEYMTIESAQKYMVAQFPELKEIVGETSRRRSGIFIGLPSLEAK